MADIDGEITYEAEPGEQFAMVPAPYLTDPDFGPEMVAVWARLKLDAWTGGRFQGLRLYSEQLGMSRNRVKRWTDRLVEYGALIIETRTNDDGTSAPNLYRLLSPQKTRGSKTDPHGSTTSPGVGSKRTPLLKEVDEVDTPPSPPEGGTSELDQDFETLWARYPRRGGASKGHKGKARGYYRRLRERFGRDEIAAALETHRAQLKARYRLEGAKWNPATIPMCTSWLNPDAEHVAQLITTDDDPDETLEDPHVRVVDGISQRFNPGTGWVGLAS